MTSKSDSNLDSSFSQSKKAIRPNLLKLIPQNSNRKKNKFKVSASGGGKLKSSESDVRYLDDPAYTTDVSHLAIPMRRNSGPESERRKSFSIIQSHFSADSSKDDSKLHKRKFHDKKKKKISDNEKKLYRNRCESSSSDEMEYNRRGQSLDRHIIKYQKKIQSLPQDTTSLDHKKYKMYARKDFVSGGKSSQQRNQSSTNYGTDYKKLSSKNSSRSRERFTPESVETYHSEELQRGANSSSTPDEGTIKDLSRFQIGKRLLKGEIGIKSFNYYLLKEGLKSSKKTLFKNLGTSAETKSFDNTSRSDENIYEEIYFVDKTKKSLISNQDCDLCIQECTKKNCDICRANELIGKRMTNEKSFRDPEAMTDQSLNMNDLGQHRQNVLQYQSYNPNKPGVYKIETTPVAFTNDYSPICQQQQLQPRNNNNTSYMHQQSCIHQNARNTSSSSDSIHQKNFARQPMPSAFNEEQTTPPDLQGSRASIVSENVSIRSSDNSNNYHKTAEMSDSSIGDSLFSYSAHRRFFGSSESCRFGYECRRCSYDGEKVSFSDTCRYDCRNCDCSSSYFSSDFDEANFSRNNSTRWSANMLHHDDDAGRKTKQYAQDFFKHVTNVKKKTSESLANVPREASSALTRGINHNSDSKQNAKQPEKIVPNGKSSLSSLSKSSSSKSSPLHDQFDSTENNLKTGAVPKSNKSKKMDITSYQAYEKTKIEKVTPEQCDQSKLIREEKHFNDKAELDNIKNARYTKLNQKISAPVNTTEDSRIDNINVETVPKKPDWLDLEDDEVFEVATIQTTVDKPISCVTSVGATNSNLINPISVPEDTTCADTFAPIHSISDEFVQPSSVVIQSPIQPHPRLFETTTKDKEYEKNNMDHGNDEDDCQNVKIDAESGNVPRNDEEKSKEEVVILSTEKTSNFSKTATISIVSDVAGGTLNRNLHTEKKQSPTSSSSKITKATDTTPEVATLNAATLFDSIDLPDFPLPLPDLPVKKKSQESQKIPVADYHHSLPTSYKTKQRTLEKLKQFPLQRTATENMLSRKLPNRRESEQYFSFNDDMPKYLFGERSIPAVLQKVSRPDEKIFLNKSGWVQVNQRHLDKSPMRGSRRHSKTNIQDDLKCSNVNRFNSLDRTENINYNHPSHKFSKIEELISRDEARSINVTLKKFDLDPRISALLNDRPGFLPIKRITDDESPPPITPIISPPPAFQDSKSSKLRTGETISRIHLSVNHKSNTDKMKTGANKKNVNQCSNTNNINNISNNNNKGMVFSRSFEYDNREPRQYNEIFSKSFDYDFKTPFTEEKRSTKEKTKTFTNLTGVSPNYLTKKERSVENSRDNSPQHQHQYLEPLPIVRQIKQKSHVRTTLSIRPEKFRSLDEEKGRSRRAQFTKTNIESSTTDIGQGYRSFESMAINKRLNSCDSGARSDLSNDEIDSDNQHSNGLRTNYLFLQSRNSQNMIKKQRSLTPDKSSDDQSQISKQRYLNSEKRITKNSSIDSQGSVYLKSSSSSRSSILDRQQHRIDDKQFVSSRSSSTSSFSGGEHEQLTFNRSKYRQQDNQILTGSRIRRSRSLQLTEKSPSRSKQAFKIASGLSNVHNGKHLQPLRDRPNKRPDQTTQSKQHSFEAEHNKFQYNSKLDFDKSRSFDDDYGTDVNRASKFINENRSLSNDRVFASNSANAPPKTKNSPQSYGTRLYDHEMMYDLARKSMDRSPIMEFNDRKRDQSRNRERSPNSSNEHLLSHRNSKNHLDYYASNQGDLSPKDYMRNRLSPGSEIDIVHDYDMKYKTDVLDNELIKEAKLVTEFLYGNRTKAEILLNQRRKEQKQLNQRPGTMSSSGSCTASSCDFWPHCGIQNIVSNQFQQHKQSHSKDDRFCDSVNSVSNSNQILGSNSLHIEKQLSKKCSANDRKCDAGGDKNKTVIKLTAKPPIYDRLNSKTSIKCLLDDREMPITREQKRGSKNRGSTGSDSGLSSERYNLRSTINTFPNRKSPKLISTPIMDSRPRSLSLPWYIHTNRSQTDEDFRSFDSFAVIKSKHPMRSVSCPSIIENHIEQGITIFRNEKESTDCNQKSQATHHQNHHVGGVFQKLKNTFSHLKGKNLQNTDRPMTDTEYTSSIYHFGPLKWRSSKERRKVKQIRRDKCNSGDSGIHVEHDNDSETNENTPPMGIRRSNSGKDATKIKEITASQNSERHQLNICQGKSISQPTGLNMLTRDQYESDSVNSNFNSQEVLYAEVLFPFEAAGDQELALEKGALVEVIRRDKGPWWWGQIKYDEIVSSIVEDQPQGWFPKDFVRVIPKLPKSKKGQSGNHTSEIEAKENIFLIQSEFAEAINRSVRTSPSKTSQNSELIRENVVKELLETEMKYVNLLSSLCNGLEIYLLGLSNEGASANKLETIHNRFLNLLRRRPDIFSIDSLTLIFANIEQIWQFQQTFLDALQTGIQQNRIAETFIEFQSAFMVYSIYCNSYSRALMELESFSENEEALNILEDCRVTQNLPELPLSAHLLAPIQRLCRYPLHLSELVKFTPNKEEILRQQPSLINITKSEAEMIDCKETLELALGAMKRVTEMVNEGKRHSEYLLRIQSRIDEFQGPPISVHSTRLFLQSDAIHVTPNIWNNTYTLFLFDHQIIYCKKDLLKRTHIYKGRIFLENCRILNLPDGKMFGVTLKNALRLFCVTRNKWLDFCFRSSSSKLRFLNTLSAERQFCGQNLFVSELAGEDDNSMFTDEDDGTCDHVVELEDNVVVEANVSNGLFKKSDTLPKKSRKLHKDMTATSVECHSNSLGRRRINNWFRKARSTNTTPSHSPTHQMITSNTNTCSSSTSMIGLNSIKPKQKKSSIFVSSSS